MNATIRKVLETPYWPPTLDTDTEYRRQHDDHDGKPKGGLMVMFDRMGDAYISTDCNPWLRFRTFGGGGRSERTRAALLVLAEAIRLDNADHPQSESNDQVEARRDGAPLPEKTSTPLPRTSC